MIQRQSVLSKRLGLGVACSLIPAAGVGSAIAVFIGWRARGEILASEGKLAGMGLAAWCVGFGGLGLAANVVLLGWMLLQ